MKPLEQMRIYSNSNDLIFDIDTNGQNDYKPRTKKGNAGLFVNKL